MFSDKLQRCIAALLILQSAWMPAAYGNSKYPGTMTQHEIKVGKSTRKYSVYTPDIVKDMDKVSAIIAFHGPGQKPEEYHKQMDLDQEAADYAFIMVYPAGLGTVWNAGRGKSARDHKVDDATFAEELIPHIIKNHKADPKKIFAMGYSDGAQMATRLACDHADKIYAAASVSHSMNQWGCNPSHEISMIFMHGMKDPRVPFKGGTDYNFASHTESVNFFRSVNGITSSERTVKVNDSLKCRHYSNKKRSTFVIGCRLYEDGHQWPGSKGWKVGTYGSVNKSMDAAYFIMRRFYKLKAEKKARDTTKVVAQGRINAGLSHKKVLELAEVRKQIRYRTLGTNAAKEATKKAAQKAAQKVAASKPTAKKPAPAKARPKPQAIAKRTQPAQSQPKATSAPAVPKQPKRAPLAQTATTAPAPLTRNMASVSPFAVAASPSAETRLGTSTQVSSSTSAYASMERLQATWGSQTIDYSVLSPPSTLASSGMRIALFVSPDDVTAEQMAAVVDAERNMIIYQTLFVHVRAEPHFGNNAVHAVLQALEDVAARFELNNASVFAVGYSEGGALVQRMFCDYPAAFRAAATVSYTWQASDCQPTPRIPVLVMQNKQDQRHPFDGNSQDQWGFMQTIANLSQHAPFTLVKEETVSQKDHRCDQWLQLDGTKMLQSCSFDWGGNTIPGAKAQLAGKYGQVMTSFNGPEYVYEFMAEFTDMPFSFGLYRHSTPMVFH
ncbi:MAG: PHB depolymerase family esterase [Pseudomonadota bacterium]